MRKASDAAIRAMFTSGPDRRKETIFVDRTTSWRWVESS
jgi:hypothetical protein